MKCEICKKSFKHSCKRSTNYSFGIHLRDEHALTVQQYYDSYLKPKGTGQCMHCSKPTEFLGIEYGYREYCSIKCMRNCSLVKNRAEETCLKKYGVKNPQQNKRVRKKSEETCLEKYGAKSPLESEVILKKIKKTLIKNHGVEKPFMSDDIQSKATQTHIEKYGNERFVNTEEGKKKAVFTRRSNFFDALIKSDRLKGLVKPLFSLKGYRGSQHGVKWQCLKCNAHFISKIEDGLIPRCMKCFPSMRWKSKYEEEISKWLKEIGIGNIKRNERGLIKNKWPLELDFYLPEHGLAIEFNGLWAHSEINGNKERSYHLSKTRKCEEIGVNLIHIFEDEWIDKQEIVKSIILNKLGMVKLKLMARKCTIAKVCAKDARAFLIDNHLQEPSITKNAYGLYHENELVQILIFSKPRFTKKYDQELLRSCAKINTVVNGGFEKLLKFAIEDLKIERLISYVDRRYFNGSGYKNWNRLKSSAPNYYYFSVNDMRRASRMQYQKHKLKSFISYESCLSEWQIMQLEGYDRIWDCGNLLFELVSTPK